MRFKKLLAMALSTVVVMSSLAMGVFASEDDIAISELNFPDDAFRRYISRSIDKDHDDRLSPEEIASVERIVLNEENLIESIEGISVFYNLKYFCAEYLHNLTKVDLSDNKELVYVYLTASDVTSVNVRGCTKLIELGLYQTRVSYVDITTNPVLSYIDVSGTHVTRLNGIHNSTITDFMARPEDAVMKVYKDYDLRDVSCVEYGSASSYIYFCYDEGCEVITTCPDGLVDIHSDVFPDAHVRDALVDEVDANHDQLLSAEEIADAVFISIQGDLDNNDGVTSLAGLEMFTNLQILLVNECSFVSFDGTPFANLEKLYITHGESLTTVNVRNNPKLESLCVIFTGVNSLDLSGNPALSTLSVYETNITELDISNNPALVNVYRTGISEEITFEDSPEHFYTYFLDSSDWMDFDVGVNVIWEQPTPVVTPTVTPTPTNTPTNTPARPTATPTTAVTPTTAPVSEAGVAGFVERLYTIALDRSSDAAGKADWVDRVYNQGYTGADVARGFLFSPEFLEKDMNNGDFVDVLYRVFFDRVADAAGRADWISRMESGWSKQDVIMGFINSTEWANVCLRFGIESGGAGVPNITIEPSEQIVAFATRLYTTCMGRNPDQTGLDDWAFRLANRQVSGTSAAWGFFFSAEFQAANYDNTEYINRLYRTFMGREADQGGMQYWQGRIADGATREDVFYGFANSDEFGAICSSYGIIR